MTASSKQVVGLYVDRSCQQWIVRDPEGDFWVVPPGEKGWQQRRPFDLSETSELEPIPGHYIYLLNLPF